jgi:hypothetical protein
MSAIHQLQYIEQSGFRLKNEKKRIKLNKRKKSHLCQNTGIRGIHACNKGKNHKIETKRGKSQLT